MNATARRWSATLPILVLSAACSREPPAVGVLMSTTVPAAARAAAAAPGDGPVRLVIEPSSPNAAEAALDAAERMVARRVVAVVGHSNSTASLAASQVYNRAQIVQLAPTTTATAYERAGPYSFRLVPSDREQARLLTRTARSLAGNGPVAVMYENDVYGYGLYRDLQAAADSSGLRFSGAAPFLAGEDHAELQAVLAAMLAARPAVLVWLGRPLPLDALMPRLREAGVQVIGPDALDTQRTHLNADGTYTGIWFVRLLPADVHARAAAALHGRVDVDVVGAEGILAYEAVGLLRSAVAAGARQGSEIRDYLLSLGRTRPPYAGITGAIQFDEQRNLRRPWQLARVTAQGVVPVAGVR